jgi:hypothetical protein
MSTYPFAKKKTAENEEFNSVPVSFKSAEINKKVVEGWKDQVQKHNLQQKMSERKGKDNDYEPEESSNDESFSSSFSSSRSRGSSYDPL